jgi:hypothetical protein
MSNGSSGQGGTAATPITCSTCNGQDASGTCPGANCRFGTLYCDICVDADAVVVSKDGAGAPLCAGCNHDVEFELACDRILPLVIKTSYELTLQQAAQREAA